MGVGLKAFVSTPTFVYIFHFSILEVSYLIFFSPLHAHSLPPTGVSTSTQMMPSTQTGPAGAATSTRRGTLATTQASLAGRTLRN